MTLTITCTDLMYEPKDLNYRATRSKHDHLSLWLTVSLRCNRRLFCVFVCKCGMSDCVVNIARNDSQTVKTFPFNKPFSFSKWCQRIHGGDGRQTMYGDFSGGSISIKLLCIRRRCGLKCG